MLGFCSAGDGGAEAAHVNGLLGLPNDTMMESRSSLTIEERINPKIEKIVLDILLSNLMEEVRLTLQSLPNKQEEDFDVWQSLLYNPAMLYTADIYSRISVSFDVGWQQHKLWELICFSIQPCTSGWCLAVLKSKAVAMILKSKLCAYCSTWKKNKQHA